MTAYARILDTLRAAGARVVERNGTARAQCPVHESRGLTLAIRDRDGKASVHCFAGCADTDVLAEIGLAVRDLFDAPGSPSSTVERVEPPLTLWDELMLELSDRKGLGWWRGDYPSFEHVLDRMEYEHRKRGEIA